MKYVDAAYIFFLLLYINSHYFLLTQTKQLYSLGRSVHIVRHFARIFSTVPGFARVLGLCQGRNKLRPSVALMRNMWNVLVSEWGINKRLQRRLVQLLSLIHI